MPLGKEVDLGPGDIVLDGDPALLPAKGHNSQFSGRVCCGQMAGWIKMPLGRDTDLGPGDIVLDGDPARSRKGTAAPPFWPMSVMAIRSPISATAEHLYFVSCNTLVFFNPGNQR